MSLKPTNIDAQRIMAILQELKERLTLLSAVTPQVLEGLQSEEGAPVVDAMGAETFKCFCEQIRLEELYVISNTSADGTWNPDTAVANDEVKDLMEKLSKNTVDMCRKLKNTNVTTELRTNFQENRPQQMLQLIRQLDHMEELTLRRLSTTVEEERSRQELLEHYISREEAATKKRNQLEKDLGEVRRDREKAQTSRTEVLTKLKADLLDVKDSTEHKSRSLKEKYEARMREMQERHQQKEERHLKEIQTLKDKLKDQVANAQQDEDAIRKRKRRTETEIKDIVENYDVQMQFLANEYDNSIADYKKEKKDLHELEEHFAKLNAENIRIQKERELDELRAHLRKEARQRHSDAAKLVQAFWKGITTRLEFVQMKKGKKKGKGKKGKK